MSIQNAPLVATTAVAILTSPGNTVMSTMHVCNTTNATIYANIYMVPNSFIANGVNTIYSNVAVSAFNTLITQEKFALGNGDAVYANASATGLSATISYIGI